MSFPPDKELGSSEPEGTKKDTEELEEPAQPPSARRNLLLLGLLGILWLVIVACNTLIEINRRFPKVSTMTTWQRYVYNKGWARWLYFVSYFQFFDRVAPLGLLFRIDRSS
jgi:hypothetical protein